MDEIKERYFLRKFDFNDKNVLDLGCGDYRNTSFLFIKNPKMNYTGIDSDKKKLKILKSHISNKIKVFEKSYFEMDYEKDIKNFDIILLLHPNNFFPIYPFTYLDNTLIRNLYKFVNDGKTVLIYPSTIDCIGFNEKNEKIFWYIPYEEMCKTIELFYSDLFNIRRVNNLIELTKNDKSKWRLI